MEEEGQGAGMDMLPSLDSRESEATPRRKGRPLHLAEYTRTPELRHADGADENQDVKAGQIGRRAGSPPRSPSK